MLRFLIDEDLPRSLVQDLKTIGIEAQHVQDIGLRGRSDDEIFRYAVDHEAILVSADLGFSNRLRFPIGMHSAIVIVRFPNEVPNATQKRAIVQALSTTSESEIFGHLMIVEPGRIRIRKTR